MNILLETADQYCNRRMKPRRFGQRLLKLATVPVAISILFSVACGDDSPTPTPRPDPAQVEMQRTLEELGEAVTALTAQVKKLQDPDEGPEKLPAETTEATEPPAVEQTIEQPTPQPSPPPVAKATYEGPGICGRTPTVQGQYSSPSEYPHVGWLRRGSSSGSPASAPDVIAHGQDGTGPKRARPLVTSLA